jgi:hypothetical protein
MSVPETFNKYVKIGMSSKEVSEIMGKPIAISFGVNQKKSWAYHDLKSDIRYARGQNRLSSMLATGNFAYATEVQMRMAKPPKFVVNFDDENRVEGYAYLVTPTRNNNVSVASVPRIANAGIF